MSRSNLFANPVCLSSVTFVHPTQPVEISGNVSTYLSHPLTSVQNFTEIVPREPLRRGLNASGATKYSEAGHVEGYISETEHDTASGTIND